MVLPLLADIFSWKMAMVEMGDPIQAEDSDPDPQREPHTKKYITEEAMASMKAEKGKFMYLMFIQLRLCLSK